MRVLLRTDVVELNDVTALVAALDRAFTGDLHRQCLQCAGEIHGSPKNTHSQPVNLVRVRGESSATGILLITGTLDHNRVLDGSYTSHIH